MDNRTLSLVLAALTRQRPDITGHLRALTRSTDPAVAAAAQPVLLALLEEFDAKEQAKWTLRDLLKQVPKVDGGFYYALKYNATIMVRRIAIAGGIDVSDEPWVSTCNVSIEEGSWREEVGGE